MNDLTTMLKKSMSDRYDSMREQALALIGTDNVKAREAVVQSETLLWVSGEVDRINKKLRDNG